jgi:hypothetical protein
MENNGPRTCKFRNTKQKIWLDWSNTEKRSWGNTKGCLNMEPKGEQEEGNNKK